MTTDSHFELRAGALRLALRPDLGGCIAGLWHRDLPVLRCTEPAALASRAAVGCFPLVPYSNRLGYRRFRWKGNDYTHRRPTSTTARIRCTAWAGMRPWEIVSRARSNVVLRYRHGADDDWPFAFEARQYFTPVAAGDRVRWCSTTTPPSRSRWAWAGTPGFRKRARSRLHIELIDRWDSSREAAGAQGGAARHRQRHRSTSTSTTASTAGAVPARIRDEKLSLS